MIIASDMLKASKREKLNSFFDHFVKLEIAFYLLIFLGYSGSGKISTKNIINIKYNI